MARPKKRRRLTIVQTAVSFANGAPPRRISGGVVCSAHRVTSQGCEHIVVPTDAPAPDLRAPGSLLWVDVQGTSDAAFIHSLGDAYGLHPLAIEDALHLHQRAKVEPYPAHLFIVAGIAHFSDHVRLEQISLFVGDGFVVTVQENHSDGDPFDAVRTVLKTAATRASPLDAAHLAQLLLDAVVDEFFPVIVSFGDALEVLEDDVLDARDQRVLGRIQAARRDVITIRRSLWPLRDALYALAREESLAPDVRLLLRDTTDHVLRLIDLAEAYRDTVASLMELYLSTISNRLNETMRFLAVISTIFIPLTFIAGVYGMNFDTSSPYNMPELRSPIGYPIVLGGMGLVAAGLAFFFWRRGWLGRGPSSHRPPKQ